jgi:hypothetical protein
MSMHTLLAATSREELFGTIDPPIGVKDYNTLAGGANNIGLLVFVSRGIVLATIVAGLYVLFNFISAGLMYITAGGEASVNNKVKDLLTQSIMGLVIIVAAYTIIGVGSLILFGDAAYVLNPTLQGPK